MGTLARIPIGAITRAQIAARLQELVDERGPVAAARARTDLGSLYTWAVREGLVETNPVAMTNNPAAGRRSRDRVLNDFELRVILRACQDDSFRRLGSIVWLLTLTACRIMEIGDLRWEEIDLETGRMVIPGTRTKNHRPLELILPPAAIAILRSVPRQPDCDFVFGKGGRGFSTWSWGKATLDARIARAEGGSLAPWTYHDLRRTVATRMAELGVQPHIVEAILNHVSGHQRGVAGIYNRATYSNEKKAALALWADYAIGLVEGRDDQKVVALHA